MDSTLSKTRTTVHVGGLVVLAMVLAVFAGMLASAQQAYASTAWNPDVIVLAQGANDDSPKTDAGQRIDVTMTFPNGAPSVSAATAEAYLQDNITIAGRTISLTGANAASYARDVYDVAVSGNVISFKIDANTAGMTANYDGKLYIAANDTASSTISSAMGDKAVETLIGTGVAIANSNGVLAGDGLSKTFTVTNAAYNRGMVHVLIKDGDTAIFEGTGTFSNGGLTVHAHTFTTQTVANFATLICSTGNSLSSDAFLGYSFTDGTDGAFTISNDGASCANITAYIYDGTYLNARSLAVGDITEPEM